MSRQGKAKQLGFEWGEVMSWQEVPPGVHKAIVETLQQLLIETAPRHGDGR